MTTLSRAEDAYYTHSTVVLTKEDAQLLLAKNTGNRKIDKNTVAYYRRIMDDGKWLPNGDSVVLDAVGNLRSGQHRLNAFLQSRLDTLPTLLVQSKCPEDILVSLNHGKAMTTIQYLSMRGVVDAKYSNSMAKLVSVLDVAVKGGSMLIEYNKKPLDYLLEETINTTPLIKKFAEGKRTGKPSGVIAGLLVWIAKRRPDATGFVSQVFSDYRNSIMPAGSVAQALSLTYTRFGSIRGRDNLVKLVFKLMSAIKIALLEHRAPEKTYGVSVRDFASFIDSYDFAQAAEGGAK